MIVKTLKHAEKVFKRLFSFADVSIDTETVAAPQYNKDDALVYGRARIKIFSMCHRGESYSFPTNLLGAEYPTMQDYAELIYPYAADARCTKVFHNANYDLTVFRTSTKIKLFTPVWDTMIGAWVADVAVGKGLKDRAPRYGRSLRTLHIAKSMQKAGFTAVSMDVLAELSEYAEQDVVATDELYQMQTIGYIERPKVIFHLNALGKLVPTQNPMPSGRIIVEHEGPLDKFGNLWVTLHEMPYLRAAMRAEDLGFPIDVTELRKISVQCDKDRTVLLKELYKAAGEKINLESGPQIVNKIMIPHKIPCPFKSKTGKVSLSAEALFRMKGSHPLVETLINYRQLNKLQSVYLGSPSSPSSGLFYYLSQKCRIHCTMSTIGAVTGRGSASNPNLNQIPSKRDRYHIKRMFVAPKGQHLICIDYAQLELRVMALLCKDPEMSRILSDPKGDIHQNTANTFHVDRSPTAKQLNFLLLYGGMKYMLAQKLTSEGIPTTEEQAGAYIDRYNQVYYRVHEYRQELLEEHMEKGYVRLFTGRRRWLYDIDWTNRSSVHKAETTLSNNVVQGSGQDFLKAAIIRCDPKCLNVDRILPTRMKMPKEHAAILKDYAVKVDKLRKVMVKANARWCLQVHDEVVFFADKCAAEEVGRIVADVMTWRHFFPPITDYSVPLAVEGGIGENWEHAKSKTPLVKLHAGL